VCFKHLLLVLLPTKAKLRTVQYKCHIKCHKMFDKIQLTIAIKKLDKMLFDLLVIIYKKRNEF